MTKHPAPSQHLHAILEMLKTKGCTIHHLPGAMISPEGDVIKVLYMLNPETGGFHHLYYDEGELIAPSELETMERRLGIDLSALRKPLALVH